MNCEEENCEEMNFQKTDPTCSKLQNSDILKDLDKKLSHLDQTQRDKLKMLILEYEHLFSDIPTRTDQIYHDVDIEGSKSIKQYPAVHLAVAGGVFYGVFSAVLFPTRCLG